MKIGKGVELKHCKICEDGVGIYIYVYIYVAPWERSRPSVNIVPNVVHAGSAQTSPSSQTFWYKYAFLQLRCHLDI